MGVLKYFPGLTTTPASTTPASTTPASSQDEGIPWWVWLMIVMFVLVILVAFASNGQLLSQ